MTFIPIEPITACLITVACLNAPAQTTDSSLELHLRPVGASVSAVSLTCQPPGGTHPQRDHACAALAAVNGDFGRLRARQGACTLIYQPVDVSAEGSWRGKRITFAANYANRCMADIGSNGVFKF